MLYSSLRDQAALYGVLLKIDSLELILLSLEIGEAISAQEGKEETPPLREGPRVEQTEASFRRDNQRTQVESAIHDRKKPSRAKR